MTKIINLYGSPGSGKTTNAVKLFSYMKAKGIKSAYVHEYAQELFYQKSELILDQFYVTMVQANRVYNLLDKVDYIITDSPAIVGAFYNSISSDPEQECFNAIIKTYYKKCERDNVEHVHVFLKRTQHYSENGRFHTQEESSIIDKQMMAYLDGLGLQYVLLDDDEKAVEKYFYDTFYSIV